MALAFAPFHWWWLPLPLLLLWLALIWSRGSARQAFWSGWGFGLGYFGMGISWVYNSLYEFGHAPVAVAAGLTLLLVVYMALFPALAAWLWLRLKVLSGSFGVWLLLPIWFVVEQLRAWLLTGFPWLTLGYSQVESPLAVYAPVIGVYGLSLILVALALALWQLLLRQQLWLALPLLLALPLGGWLLQSVSFSRVDGAPLKVALVQGNTEQHLKWRQDYRNKIIRDYWSATNQLWDRDLVVWPEAAIPGKTQELQESLLDPMQQQALKHDTQLLVGIIASDWVNRINYNSMLLLGKNQGRYDKRHLVPYGEFIPLRDWLRFMERFIQIPVSDMQSGEAKQTALRVADTQLGVSICYESVFPRDLAVDLPTAGVLVNASNDAWFGDSLAPPQHLQIAQMRALEFNRPMIRATSTGISAFIDHQGHVIERSQQFVPAVLKSEIQPRSGTTPIVYLLPWYPWLALLLGLLMLGWIYRPARAL